MSITVLSIICILLALLMAILANTLYNKSFAVVTLLFLISGLWLILAEKEAKNNPIVSKVYSFSAKDCKKIRIAPEPIIDIYELKYRDGILAKEDPSHIWNLNEYFKCNIKDDNTIILTEYTNGPYFGVYLIPNPKLELK